MTLNRESVMERLHNTLPGWFGIEFDLLERGHAEAHMEVRAEMLAPNGYLHAASIIALADSAAGFGSAASLPKGAESFTTVELKSNFLGTVREGAIRAVARLVHGGRQTQVWDVEVRSVAGEKLLALFRCTQMMLYPRTQVEKRN